MLVGGVSSHRFTVKSHNVVMQVFMLVMNVYAVGCFAVIYADAHLKCKIEPFLLTLEKVSATHPTYRPVSIKIKVISLCVGSKSYADSPTVCACLLKTVPPENIIFHCHKNYKEVPLSSRVHTCYCFSPRQPGYCLI